MATKSESGPFASNRAEIAFLDTGGTLSATTHHVEGRREILIEDPDADRFHRVLTANISRHLQHFFGWTKFLTGLRPFGWDRIHYPDSRILSENSGPPHWREIIRAISSYIDVPQGMRTTADILGIIICHGTDTMAQVVPAIQASINIQNVPIVFVGSNYPLLLDTDEQLRLSCLRSDAWQNILAAVGFCALAGSIPPQVLVSFGRCIHQALNLKKIVTLQPRAIALAAKCEDR